MNASSLQRCQWPGIADREYARYHDEEWGVPLADDRALFEKLILEGFQSGLSWLTILRKRDNFRNAFDNFAPERIARYTSRDVVRLLDDPGIVRNRAKIEATIHNANAYLKIAQDGGLAAFVWSFAPPIASVPAPAPTSGAPTQTEASKAMSKALKKRGFRFVGPTTAYAFMQSTGMVNDHAPGCHRREPCARLQCKFNRPDLRTHTS